MRYLGDDRAAVAVGGGDEARSHVIAEERKLRDVGPSLTDKMPPVSPLFSEYPSVVWRPKGMPLSLIHI